MRREGKGETGSKDGAEGAFETPEKQRALGKRKEEILICT